MTFSPDMSRALALVGRKIDRTFDRPNSENDPHSLWYQVSYFVDGLVDLETSEGGDDEVRAQVAAHPDMAALIRQIPIPDDGPWRPRTLEAMQVLGIS